VEELPRLSHQLGGPRILVKRDDQTGLATGGNKTRKLEFLVADALGQGADTLVTQGSAQSNHCRQTAAAAARHGLGCVLLLRGPEPRGTAEANLLLDRILGASLRFGAPSLEDTGRELRAQGHRPYLIPTGGSNEIGVMGYVAAMEELASQLRSSGQQVDAIVLPTGSGGTQAGLLLGARTAGLPVRVLGVSVSRSAAAAREAVAELANRTAARLEVTGDFASEDVEVDDAFLGDGFGVMSDLEARAIRTMGATEGLLLDPVYTGRAFGALMALVSRRTFTPEETVLFWHTGGTPALFVSDHAAAL
jgi:D-cysteine desulfhydrase